MEEEKREIENEESGICGKRRGGAREGGKTGGGEWNRGRAERGGRGGAKALETVKPGTAPGLCGSRKKDQVGCAVLGLSRLAWPARSAAHSIDRANTPVKSRSLASVLRKKKSVGGNSGWPRVIACHQPASVLA